MYVLAFKVALSQLKTNIFSRLIVVLSVAAILLINGMVYLLFQGVSRSLAEVRASHFITAYLDSTVVPAKEAEVVSAVRKLPGVVSAQLVSKDSFIENFSRYFPQLSTELTSLDADTIPRYVKIKVSDTSTSSVQEQLNKVKGIEAVELNQNRYAGLIGALSTLRKLSLVLLAGMSVALLCVLLNHFKLRTTLQTQVLSTLTLLGARGHQVLLPFAFEGMLEGVLGGGIAAGTLLLYGKVLESQIGGLFAAIGYRPFQLQLAGLAVLLVAVGATAGVVGSLWATARARALALA